MQLQTIHMTRLTNITAMRANSRSGICNKTWTCNVMLAIAIHLILMMRYVFCHFVIFHWLNVSCCLDFNIKLFFESFPEINNSKCNAHAICLNCDNCRTCYLNPSVINSPKAKTLPIYFVWNNTVMTSSYNTHMALAQIVVMINILKNDAPMDNNNSNNNITYLWFYLLFDATFYAVAQL